jgi:hypothetical protein
MADNFSEYQVGLGDPYENGAAITPHDSNDLSNTTRAIYIGSTGDLKVDLVGGDTVTLASVPVGVIRLRATRVYSTGTTASDLVALY